MPPTHFEGGNVNIFQPYVVGQSGTDRPESVLVTKLPARISRTVLAATYLENLCSISGQGGLEGPERQDLVRLQTGGAGGDRPPFHPAHPAHPAYPALPALVVG